MRFRVFIAVALVSIPAVGISACSALPACDADGTCLWTSSDASTIDGSSSEVDGSRGDAAQDHDATGPQADGSPEDAGFDGVAPLDSSLCSAGELNCPGSGCVDTTTSMANCGGCAIPCLVPEGGAATCASSACTQTCPGTQVVCSDTCVDTTSNTEHCGSCSMACTAPTGGSTSCVASTCTAACPPGEHVCSGQCLPNSDPPSLDSCVLTEMYGVFVSPTGSDSAAGTRAAPFLTIAHAMQTAHTKGVRVYACATAGAFTSALSVDATMDGVQVFGGLSCVSSTWTYAGTATSVAPTSSGPAATINGLSTGVSFTDFEFSSASAAAGSGASVLAVLVTASSNVTFERASMNAGNAGSGPGGSTTTNYSAMEADGGNPATGIFQGPAITCTCSAPVGSSSEGGRGGDSDPTAPSGGAAGSSSPAVATPAANGGSPQSSASGCSSGNLGANGADGDGGAATTLSVSLSSAGLIESGGVGASGTLGSVAQGGGGGGGGISVTSGGGGGGGCGGCGGGYGTGGAPGGTSAALASINSSVTLSGGTFTSGSGGTGGPGGPGQAGQMGGGGGAGSLPGCGGGSGGNGGRGGGGGGGAGGNSYPIVYTGTAPTLTNTPSLVPGTVGAGGTAGTGGGAKPGNPGVSSTTVVAL